MASNGLPTGRVCSSPSPPPTCRHVRVPQYQGHMCWAPLLPFHTHLLNPEGYTGCLSATQQGHTGKNREHTSTWPSVGSKSQGNVLLVGGAGGGGQPTTTQQKLEVWPPVGRPQGRCFPGLLSPQFVYLTPPGNDSDSRACPPRAHRTGPQKITEPGTSLVAQWLRIHLPMQGTRVRALVWEDSTCRGATKPMRHNY